MPAPPVAADAPEAAHDGSPRAASRARRPVWALPVVIIAVLAVAAALVVGLLGLFANPVRSVAPDGTATLAGAFEPYQCTTVSCNGYVQAGARSVFVQFPAGCPEPARGAQVTVVARPAPDLGSGSYRATRCA
ncbi:MAG: hypothetical protein JOZ46_04680 [Candidatus Dormibacteraeota bacterium]|nr:hypothetical protein [Candidatus Dormibacteraeota bacterium]MBV9525094.1 hypothetical protein [Candidatus Dormibacteraeota bacterium]